MEGATYNRHISLQIYSLTCITQPTIILEYPPSLNVANLSQHGVQLVDGESSSDEILDHGLCWAAVGSVTNTLKGTHILSLVDVT